MRRIPAWNRSALLLLTAVTVYFQTWADLWPYWEHKNATYTHGTLIALTSIWLVWRSRPALVGVAPRANPFVLPIVLLLSAVWLLLARANVFIVHAMLWPVLAFAILWAGTGWRVASKFVFPLSFLYFAIPVWDYLKPPLQAITSTMVGILTTIAGLPAIVNGPTVTLPDATIFIALDCSGAHFLSVAIAVGVLAGAIRGDSARTRILIVILAGLLSMIFNWVRILLIVLAYLNADLRHGLETMGHYTFGWWVFAIDLVAFYLALRWIPHSARPAPSASPTHSHTAEPQSVSDTRVFLSTFAALLLLPASSWAVQRAHDYPSGLQAAIPIPGVSEPLSPDVRWQPKFQGAAWQHRVAYVWPPGRVIELYRNEYHEQSQAAELTGVGAVLFDPDTFTVRAAASVRISLDASHSIAATRVELADTAQQPWVAFYTYIVGDHTVGSAVQAQFLTAYHALYRRTAAGVLAVAAPCTPNCTTVSATLEQALASARQAYQQAQRE